MNRFAKKVSQKARSVKRKSAGMRFDKIIRLTGKERNMSKNKSAAIRPAVRVKRPLKKRIADNWQLYAMLAVPVILTVIYKYIPMYGIQIAFRDYKASRGFMG